ncbi:MAG TPA: 50S ribosomal protein L15 [Tepidisphaeraceae bacterium]
MSMIHDITPVTPRNKKGTRRGRGESSGHGKTSGRGNKGAKARQGTYIKRGHEGGQTPIFRRFPKRGFSNHDFARRFHIVNLSDLDRFDSGAVVDAAMLHEAGLIPDLSQPVKILGDGKVSKKLTVVAGWFSRSAHAKITEAGGTPQDTKGNTFEFPKPKKKFIPREPVKKKIATDDAAEAKDAKPAEGKAPAAEGKGPDAKPESSAPAAE